MLLRFKTLTCTTKSRPRKSAMVLGRRVRPHTNLRKSERSVLEKDSITSQNHWMSGAVGSTPLYVATDFSRWSGMSGLPHTWKTWLGLWGVYITVTQRSHYLQRQEAEQLWTIRSRRSLDSIQTQFPIRLIFFLIDLNIQFVVKRMVLFTHYN